MRDLLLRKGKKEVDRREVRGGKGRGRDLPDQCQSASYAPVLVYSFLSCAEIFICWTDKQLLVEQSCYC